MPNTYRKMGVEFQYPETWRLDEEEALAGNHSITVQSPEEGFWTLTVHPQHAAPQQLVDAVRQAMRDEYPDLDAEAVTETMGGRKWIGYDLNFICLDLTNSACVRAAQTPSSTLVIFCQAEDREFERIGLVFRAMTTSLAK